jgi:DNA repair protein RecO (recombination protein O)
MSTYKTQAIVIAKRPFIEDDRFYIVYSQDQGKLELVVKAAAKSSSKLAGQLEPFALVRLMVVRGKNLETIAGAQRLKAFNFTNLDSYYLASYLAEIIIKTTKPSLGDEKIYQLLFKALSFLEQECKVEIKRLMAVKFTWQVLKLLGHSADLADMGGIKVLSGLSAGAKEL